MNGRFISENLEVSLVKKIKCNSCGNKWDVEPPIGREESCSSCNREAKVCLNCQFFDGSAYRSCRENQAEWVKDKEKANFCDYFSPNLNLTLKNSIQNNMDQLESLFGSSQNKSELKDSKNSLQSQLDDFLKSKK